MLIPCAKQDWLNHFDHPKLASVLLTFSCENKCIFCAAADQRCNATPGEHLATAAFEAWLDRCVAGGVKLLTFSGAGDPLTHPEIANLVRAVASCGIQPYAYTHAQRCDRAQAEELYQNGLHEALVSIHGHDSATHDRATRTPGSLARTLRGLGHLRSAGMRIQTNTVITILNVHSLSQVLEQLDVEEMAFSYPQFQGEAGVTCSVPYEQAARALRPVLAQAEIMGRPVTVENIPPCFIPYSEYQPMPDYPVLYKDRDLELTVRPSEVDKTKGLACKGCQHFDCPGIDLNYPYDFIPGAFRDHG